MSTGRDQGSIERFEIFHDVLAPAIIDWHRRFEGTQLTKDRVFNIVNDFILSGTSTLGIISGILVLGVLADSLIFGFRMLILWLNDKLFGLIFGP